MATSQSSTAGGNGKFPLPKLDIIGELSPKAIKAIANFLIEHDKTAGKQVEAEADQQDPEVISD
jgi:hypothetical protein